MESTEAAVEKCLTILREAQKNSDFEAAHGDADDALIGFIRFLGFAEIADAWEKVGKWYA